MISLIRVFLYFPIFRERFTSSCCMNNGLIIIFFVVHSVQRIEKYAINAERRFSKITQRKWMDSIEVNQQRYISCSLSVTNFRFIFAEPIFQYTKNDLFIPALITTKFALKHLSYSKFSSGSPYIFIANYIVGLVLAPKNL